MQNNSVNKGIFIFSVPESFWICHCRILLKMHEKFQIYIRFFFSLKRKLTISHKFQIISSLMLNDEIKILLSEDTKVLSSSATWLLGRIEERNLILWLSVIFSKKSMLKMQWLTLSGWGCSLNCCHFWLLGSQEIKKRKLALIIAYQGLKKRVHLGASMYLFTIHEKMSMQISKVSCNFQNPWKIFYRNVLLHFYWILFCKLVVHSQFCWDKGGMFFHFYTIAYKQCCSVIWTSHLIPCYKISKYLSSF